MQPIPESTGRAARIALAMIAGALGTAVVGGALWMAFRPAEAPKQVEIEPAEETVAETLTASPATGSAESSATTGTGGPTGTGEPNRPSTKGAANKRIAYRLGESLWVAREDGAQPRAVSGAYDVYRLSPDGRQLAVVPSTALGTSGRISVYEVETGRLRLAGSSVGLGPISWSPDSSWIAYASGAGPSTSVRRVRPDGSGDGEIAPRGTAPRFSRDGARIAFLESDPAGPGSQLIVFDTITSTFVRVARAEAAGAFDWGSGANLYFTKRGVANRWEVWRASAPFKTAEKVGAITVSAPAYALTGLRTSPDGRRLLLAAVGDDEYSRALIVDTKTGSSIPVTSRRDTYPYGWTADGSRILYFEGNDYQGETTSLISAGADGSKRFTLVSGAAR